MKIDEFANALEILADNFNFKIQNKLWIKRLFQLSNSFSDEEIRYGLQIIAKKTMREWNDEYGYSGKPSFADWINYFEMKKKDDDYSKYSEKQYNIANKARIAAIEKTANECFDSKEDREKFISMALDGKQSIPTLKPISPDLIKNTINNLKK